MQQLDHSTEARAGSWASEEVNSGLILNAVFDNIVCVASLKIARALHGRLCQKTFCNIKNLHVIIKSVIHEKAFQRLVTNILMVCSYQRR